MRERQFRDETQPMPRGPYLQRSTDWIRDRATEPLARTSLGLATSTLLSAVLGILFWTVAARLFRAEDVGRDSALIAALLAISGIAQLNLNNIFPRFLPQVLANRGRWVTTGYIASAGASLVAALAFILVAPRVAHSFAFARGSVLLIVLFPLSVAAWSVFSLQDAVLVALGRAAWLPVENGLFSVARVIVLPLGVVVSIHHIVFLGFVLPMFVAIAIVSWCLANIVLPRTKSTSAHTAAEAPTRGAFGGYFAKDFAGTVLAQVMMAAIPLIVVVTLGAATNAYFYVPFTLITTFDALFLAVASSLTTEAARRPDVAHVLARKAVRLVVLLELPAALVVAAAAPLLLAPYGHAYVAHGADLLRLLVAASCFRSVVFLYGATARLEGTVGRLLVVQLVSAVLAIGGVLWLSRVDGLTGVGIAWLGTWVLLAAATAPTVWRFLQRATIWGAASSRADA